MLPAWVISLIILIIIIIIYVIIKIVENMVPTVIFIGMTEVKNVEPMTTSHLFDKINEKTSNVTDDIKRKYINKIKSNIRK